MSTTFYVVSIPREYETSSGPTRLLTTLEEASKLLKQYKGSRMKSFNSRENAQKFIEDTELNESMLNLSISSASSPVLSPSIKQEHDFPSARNEDLSKLKKAIEGGQEPAVKEMIEANPRLIIAVCDTPVILMAGPRYNACHIAARSNQASILNLILDTLADVDYVSRLYPDDPMERILDCQLFVTDLYLNTPDKVLGNTPLHFACKLGHENVVRALLANKHCDIDKVDRQGKTARQCICERFSKPDKEKTRDRIDALFQTRQSLRRERAHHRERRAASESPRRSASESPRRLDTGSPGLDWHSYVRRSLAFGSPIKGGLD